MQHVQARLSWRIILPLWWAAAWRIFLAMALLHLCGLTDDDDSLLADIILWFFSLWAAREALMDRYTSFTFTAESKATGLSLFTLNKRLSWFTVLRVWWAYSWRMSLIPLAVLLGSIGCAVLARQDPIEALGAYLSPTMEYFTSALLLIASPIMMREALALRYRHVRFAAQERLIPTSEKP